MAEGLNLEIDATELAAVIYTAPGVEEGVAPKIAQTILESPWFASLIRTVMEQTVRAHAQTIMDAQRSTVTEALAEAEMRGYQRQVGERLLAAIARHEPDPEV